MLDPFMVYGDCCWHFYSDGREPDTCYETGRRMLVIGDDIEARFCDKHAEQLKQERKDIELLN